MKADPAIKAVETIVSSFAKGGARRAEDLKKKKKEKFQIILLSPSKKVFTQKIAHSLSESENIIFVCTRYEGIDYRFEQYMKKKYGKQFQKISL
jgi:tRNA G37 N-methylase TrmD